MFLLQRCALVGRLLLSGERGRLGSFRSSGCSGFGSLLSSNRLLSHFHFLGCFSCSHHFLYLFRCFGGLVGLFYGGLFGSGVIHFCGLLTHGSSLSLRFIVDVLSNGSLVCGLLAYAVKVDLSQRLILLGCAHGAFGSVVVALLGSALLLFGLFLQQLFSLCAHFLILFEGFNQCCVLLVAELEAQFGFYLAQLTSLFEEFNCRLKSYV